MSKERDGGRPEDAESMAEVLAAIRSLVSAEAAARTGGRAEGDVLLLTPDMRIDGDEAGLADGLDEAFRQGPGAPILDEESLRGMINGIVREELQGELGERINRNLRRLIRRELAQMLEEMRAAESKADGAP